MMRTPFLLALVMAETMATGVARVNAHGQPITRRTRLLYMDGVQAAPSRSGGTDANKAAKTMINGV